ncbi:MAG: NADH:flavin oxidoreductase, partial [Deltaproteobacteria bacterium]|nr:NADH:flavin oxidoreductase [Deltaproteobacteria bacterium]
YVTLAEGEVGLIVTAATLVEASAYKKSIPVEGESYSLAMDEDRYIEDWKKIVASVHEKGSKIAMQIVHPGRQESPKIRGTAPIAPSAVPVTNTNIVPREMTIEEIKKMVEHFAQSIRRVKEAGFDAVQLHGGHGYLISNFISPYANVRNDDYGGSTENRARFITEILQRAREMIGPDYPVMIKMNCDDFIHGGLDRDEAVMIAGVIVQAGIDCIETTGGTASDSPLNVAAMGINTEEKEAYFQSYAEALKKNISVPLVLVGGLRTPHVMEKIISEGVADFVSMSRPLIREPGLIKRWKDGALEKAKCISCNMCALHVFKRPLRCYADNPLEED